MSTLAAVRLANQTASQPTVKPANQTAIQPGSPLASLLVPILVSVDQTVSPPQVTISPKIVSIAQGCNCVWNCDTAGDLCVGFANSSAPIAFEQALGGGMPPSIGPYAVLGVPTYQYQYKIGWRLDSTQPWIFSDPIIIVDNPT